MFILIVIRSALQFCVIKRDVYPVGYKFLEGVEDEWGGAGVGENRGIFKKRILRPAYPLTCATAQQAFGYTQ